MNEVMGSLCGGLAWLMALAFLGCPGRTGDAQTPVPHNFRVEPVRQVRKGVDLWPLLVRPVNPAEERVNATLARLNEHLSSELVDCDKNYLEFLKFQSGDKKESGKVSGDWTRKVTITMWGPRFLSLFAAEDFYCGGVHPDHNDEALVFDLDSGNEVNWVDMGPGSARTLAGAEPAEAEGRLDLSAIPALAPMLLLLDDDGCKNIYRDPPALMFWPDAKRGTLDVLPVDLPHVIQGCALRTELTMGQARKLGFSETLLSAIEEAHRRVVAGHSSL